VTVRAMEVVLLSEPEMPVTITVFVPTTAVALAFRVSVRLCLFGPELNAAVTPEGSPLTEPEIAPLKPF